MYAVLVSVIINKALLASKNKLNSTCWESNTIPLNKTVTVLIKNIRIDYSRLGYMQIAKNIYMYTKIELPLLIAIVVSAGRE